MQLIIILFLFFVLLIVVFTLQNTNEVSLNLLFWELPDVPLVLLVLCSVMLGYLLSLVYFYPKLWKTKREYNKLIKFNKELKELHDLNQTTQETEESNPEGIELDENDDDGNTFFRD
jgi:uncharacterized integral membrane protein